VKVDPAALNAKERALNALDCLGTENVSHSKCEEHVLNGKANAKTKEEKEREQQQIQEEAAKRAEEARQEMAAQMSRRVKEQAERQEVQQRQLETERRQLQLEHEDKEREEQQVILQSLQAEQQRKIEAEQNELEAEREEARREEEARRVQAWLSSNGFKGLNDLVRKRFTKVTPLHFAVGQNNPEMVKLLLDAGADPLGINGKKETPMKLAEKLNKNSSHASIVQVFTTHKKEKQDKLFSFS